MTDDTERCECACHARPEWVVLHTFPCCTACPVCRLERIPLTRAESHKRECRERTLGGGPHG